MSALRLSIRLAHIRPSLGLAIKRRSIAVIDVARRIHPHQPRPTSRSSRLRCRYLRRTQPFTGSRSRNRLRQDTGNRRRRRHRLRLLSARRRRHRGWSSRVPGLHPLMPVTSPRLLSRRRVRPVLTDPVRPSRSSLGHLCTPKGVRTQSQHPTQHQSNLLHRTPQTTRI